MNYEGFKDHVMEAVKDRPPFIREGQAVFNYVDAFYRLARAVQIEDGIDCFFDDSNIEPFLKAVWARLEPLLTPKSTSNGG